MLKKKEYQKVPVDFKLGVKYTDKHSGLTGIATAKRELLNGTVQLLLETPMTKEGKQKNYYVDVGSLIEVSTERPVKPAPAGGPTIEAPRL